ncbi:23S rRNA (uracil(1939)-C(5))-methyltransferase RlmD [Dysosmobacter sp.]|uniref:23S rRNA (uracil(1939)-C(5))-methyltransferase RlmD n=1 Tax=Dysosmobacter sp. TaxID=2591382 RepID=UPI002A7ED374|nr:23S rRNA (uracil(1939)-C(5))-methyltransferase RlmD [Dysosmobacter sp.]MCI7215613.1 23S rRNA (uracil(1939)-C(5))-methyltransferase RlmD [Dysosmobacter sp.]MDY3652209.1 23S rRNA (uracil(1939)-C(5))-methyltransferase RlmD [Dysosmobacter sp.]
MEALEKGSVYTAVIDGYSSEGLGIARVNGAVVFVPHAVRGEEIDLRITKVMKTSCAGEIVKIHDPSPERMEPECPYAGKCGGCAYRHLTYPEELWAKRQRVQDALTRIGGLDLTVEEILGAKNPEHYRNKSQYPVGADGSIGFFQARTHKVVPIRRCLIQTEAADRTAQAVGEWMRRYKISAYDETTGKGLVRHVCVRVNRKGESLCCVVVNGNKVPREPELAAYVTAAVPHTVGVLLNSNTHRGNVVLGDKYRTLFGRNYLMDTLCGLEFKLSMPSFYQVNRDQAEVLYGKALEFAGLTGNETVLDLYCGIGTITLCLAKAAKRVIGAEIVPPAIRDAKENALRNQIENAEFFCGDAADIAAKLESDGLRPDVVTVDPPRKGLAPEVIASVAAMGPEKVVYVSCDPATLGRDVKIFREFGYEAKRAAAVDMFPGTAHVETVVLLSRETNPLTVEVRMEVETGEVKEHPTYKRIQEYVQEKYGFKVHTAYIAEVKRMVGLDMHKAPNAVEQRKHEYHPCPPEKVEAIKDALRHFGLIAE